MTPPPVTPNPHRFVTSTPSSRPAAGISSSRHPHQNRTPQTALSLPRQFASTPRFTFSSSIKPKISSATAQYEQGDPSSTVEQRRSLPHSVFEQIEAIEECKADQAELEEDRNDRLPQGATNTDDLERESSTPPDISVKKRRRELPEEEQIVISSSQAPSPPSSPPILPLESSPSPPTTPPPRLDWLSATAKQPRFRLPTHSSPPSTSTKPAFVLPPAPKSPPHGRTSSFLFSPQKRNQKFTPGGLAATAREWIVEESQPLYHSRLGNEEKWDITLEVEEAKELQFSGGGASLVQTKTLNEESGTKWLLVGAEEGIGKGKPRNGTLLGVRRPVWNCSTGIADNLEDWNVAVEWKIL